MKSCTKNNLNFWYVYSLFLKLDWSVTGVKRSERVGNGSINLLTLHRIKRWNLFVNPGTTLWPRSSSSLQCSTLVTDWSTAICSCCKSVNGVVLCFIRAFPASPLRYSCFRLVHIGLLLFPTGRRRFTSVLLWSTDFTLVSDRSTALTHVLYKFTALYFCVLDRSMASDGWWRAVACGFSHLYHEINAPRAIDGNSCDKSCSDGSRREVTSLISFRFI